VAAQSPGYPEPDWPIFGGASQGEGRKIGLHVESGPADYAEIVALPIPSRCGRSEIPRHNPELGITGQSLPILLG
jgi:hypothetical protein